MGRSSYLSAVGNIILRVLATSVGNRCGYHANPAKGFFTPIRRSRFWLCLLTFIEIILSLVLVTPALSFAQADIAVTQNVDNVFPTIGNSVTFTITVTNLGPLVATGVQVTDQLSSGFTFGGVTELTTGSITCTATLITAKGDIPLCSSFLWTVGDIGVNGVAILKFTATVLADGSYTNTATRTASSPTDPTPINDNALVTLLLVAQGATAGIEAPPDLIGTGYEAGDTVFDFTAIDRFGNPVSLYQFYGKFVILDLTAVWCGPSQFEAAQGLLTQVVTDLANHDIHVELLQVLLQGKTQGAPATLPDAQFWARSFNINYPVLTVTDAAEYATLINQLANYAAANGGDPGGDFPTHILLGPDLTILGVQLGVDDASITDLFLTSFQTTPAYQVFNLIDFVDDYGLPSQTTFILETNLKNALRALMQTPDGIEAACGNLKAFVQKVDQMSGTELTVTQATQLTDLAKPVQVALGCTPP